MDSSPGALALFVAFLLGFTHTPQADQVDYCQGICPTFTRKEKDGTYEVREYVQTDWMCTIMTDKGAYAAIGELNDFRNAVNIDSNTWPVLFSVKDVGGKKEYKLCYFLLPGEKPTGTDKVTMETKPPVTMFVRVFGGRPSFEAAEERAQQLKKDLNDAGETFNQTIYYGAGYESYFSVWHHNEISFIKV